MFTRRLPPSAILLLILIIVGLGVYGYFTTPLPFGLNSVISTPGGSTLGSTPPGTTPPAGAGIRAAAGQPLQLGSLTVTITNVSTNQDLTANGRGGPPGAFTVLSLNLQNNGSQAVVPQPGNFSLVDSQGRVYAPDPDASRAAATVLRARSVEGATIPPGGQLSAVLAFQTAPDASSLVLRVTLGYGEVELPH